MCLLSYRDMSKGMASGAAAGMQQQSKIYSVAISMQTFQSLPRQWLGFAEVASLHNQTQVEQHLSDTLAGKPCIPYCHSHAGRHNAVCAHCLITSYDMWPSNQPATLMHMWRGGHQDHKLVGMDGIMVYHTMAMHATNPTFCFTIKDSSVHIL